MQRSFGPDFHEIYEAIRASEMNQWVGGDDPEAVGDACRQILLKHVPIGGDSRVLDFGMGIGRVMVSLLKQRPRTSVTGFDIVPRMVAFCQETIGSRFPNTRFELLEGANDHYEKFKDGTTPKTREEIAAAYGKAFDAAYAFSVFTHVDDADFVPLLKLIASTLADDAYLLFTCFLLTPFSRDTVRLGWTLPDLSKGRYEREGEVFVADPQDRLAFIAYDLGRMEKMIREAGLMTTGIEYGNWSGGRYSRSFQDVIVCRKPADL